MLEFDCLFFIFIYNQNILLHMLAHTPIGIGFTLHCKTNAVILFAVNSNFLSLMLALMMKLIYDFSFFTWNFFAAKKRIKLGVSHTHFALVGLTVKKCR